MPTITYDPTWRPTAAAQDAIANARSICRQYAADGYDLTLRQLYYRFVAGDLFPDDRKWSMVGGKWAKDRLSGTKNAEPNYKWLGDVINNARMAGLLDWNYIVDRTRNLRGTSHWDTPGDVINSAASGYRLDKWESQPRRVEVWVEKEALAGVVERAARENDVDWFACRGYVSQSEQWRAARRLLGYLRNGQAVTILHLGDHDPSGVDMTRDITDRLTTFIYRDWAERYGLDASDRFEILDSIRSTVRDDRPLTIHRIALNMDQVRLYNPPPNPAKLTDSRCGGYIREYGNESWELDALPPDVLNALITDHIATNRDDFAYGAIEATESRQRELLNAASARWPELEQFLTDLDDDQ